MNISLNAVLRRIVDNHDRTHILSNEIIRDREAKTTKIVKSGYAERVLKTFAIWDCHPVKTPLDANNRLSKRDCPKVVDPNVHRRYHSIVGCLSYLVNMTRPDLAFTYSQLSNFVQYPGMVHLETAERVLQYVRATYDQGISSMTVAVKDVNLILWRQVKLVKK